MIKRLLIANRGEIACRIIRTCKRLGIETVAVYSHADRFAQHVKQADFSICVGESVSTKSYLNVDAIIAAAKEAGADAIHPGYGFLSENPIFTERCAEENIIFVGPKANAMRSMASKSDAKALMADADVPLIPGYFGDNQDPEFLHNEANTMGYPLLIKAVAGGGGKGMRRVNAEDEFMSALNSAVTEAQNSFGDPKVMLERLITDARHIEVQIIADQHGQCVYFGDRDCSMQRRHQKVVEECPAPAISDELRKAMGEASVRAALAINYHNAGTFEYLVCGDQFYFIEMNTRLQVEHPVTEMVFNVDLVEQQLRVASGEPLAIAQSDIKANGHAVETRIYAEDPDHNFMPSAGHINTWSWPSVDNFRLETGVTQGDWVTPFYDPMIAKAVVWAQTRDEALDKLGDIFSKTSVQPLATNIGFLQKVITEPAFTQDCVTTQWLEPWLEAYDGEFPQWCADTDAQKIDGPFALDSFKLNLENAQDRASADDYDSAEEDSAFKLCVAPMNGRVIDVCVAEGDRVSAGTMLAVMEAMKMEHSLTASTEGVVTAVNVNTNDMVNGGDLLIDVAYDEA